MIKSHKLLFIFATLKEKLNDGRCLDSVVIDAITAKIKSFGINCNDFDLYSPYGSEISSVIEKVNDMGIIALNEHKIPLPIIVIKEGEGIDGKIDIVPILKQLKLGMFFIFQVNDLGEVNIMVPSNLRVYIDKRTVKKELATDETNVPFLHLEYPDYKSNTIKSLLSRFQNTWFSLHLSIIYEIIFLVDENEVIDDWDIDQALCFGQVEVKDK